MPDINQKICFLGASMHPWTMEETVEMIAQRLDEERFTQHVVVNVAKLVNMRKDAQLRNSVESCDIINIDGTGVVWGGRFLGYDIPERVAGIDLFYRLIELATRKQIGIYLLGARNEVVEKTAQELRLRYPGVIISGNHHGYFWENEEAVVKDIRNSGAKLLFIAITSPKKENFINNWKDQLGVSFVMGVGGTFDVAAGVVKRAPTWMQNAGLEWLYRVIQEPRRMWKRYLVTNGSFALILMKARVKQILKL
jgi:N-acetylglucosaminyldiphosphoundecaprenol N-acetyl-beta-D-mannosaminyltransferase